MAYTDFKYYQNEYKGIVIDDEEKYAYFAERASDELALFVNKLPKTEEATKQLKRCECRIADILFDDFRPNKEGNGKVSSESVAGYYSVTYATTDNQAVKRQIKTAIILFLGRYLTGARPVMW